MERITSKKILELWDEILKREWMKDATLAAKVGLNPSTIASWRSGRNKTAHPYNVRMLSEKLGYRIELTPDNKWVVEKLKLVESSPQIREISSPYNMNEIVAENARLKNRVKELESLIDPATIKKIETLMIELESLRRILPLADTGTHSAK